LAGRQRDANAQLVERFLSRCGARILCGFRRGQRSEGPGLIGRRDLKVYLPGQHFRPPRKVRFHGKRRDRRRGRLDLVDWIARGCLGFKWIVWHRRSHFEWIECIAGKQLTPRTDQANKTDRENNPNSRIPAGQLPVRRVCPESAKARGTVPILLREMSQ
jgi:hypothetical protein